MTREDLNYYRQLPLDMKIRLTEQRIHEWVGEWGTDGVYISFSGGKDSTVLLDIVRRLYPDVPAVFCDTGLEYPEIREFALKQSNVVRLRPEMDFANVIKKYGYPVISKTVSHAVRIARKNPGGKVMQNLFNPTSKSLFNCSKYSYLLEAPFMVSDQCCDIIKKKPCRAYAKKSGRVPITAQMACESKLRESKWLQNGCNLYSGKHPVSNPMSFWTEQDVLMYLKKRKLPYCQAIYGDIVYDCNEPTQERFDDATTLPLKTTKASRTGCMYCAFGILQESSPNRFERMRDTHPKQYDYIINKLGMGAVLDYINAKY